MTVEKIAADHTLNPEQGRAATHLDGPLLILAGAGSGKTRVITRRIAWLIEEQGVAPWNIMAITFTNKAAKEMKERVSRMVSAWPDAVHVATFHSTCVRILRRYIDRIGYERNFDIYDTDDTKSLMKDICKHLQIDTKLYREKMLLARISHLKEELIDPVQFRREALEGGDPADLKVSDAYIEYQRRLKRSSALDFDDLISLTVQLFREHRDVLEYYQDRWKYLMVDEYQDTNKAQFVFISLLAQKYRNLCVVGDDDQSIYRFRGADIGNILNFEKIFPETEVIRLEQNYRSTQNILDAANSVISNNKGRKRKKLWTGRGSGDPVSVKRFDDAQSEAKFIADDIARRKRQDNIDYKQSAVLYRTNAQSRAIEEQLLYENIPYTIVGGTNFYARREIKDILSYLRILSNSSDDVALKRIINVPRRGIGQTSISRVDDYAHEHGMCFYDVARMADKVPGIGRGGLKIRQFVHLIEELKDKAKTSIPSELICIVMDRTGYEEELREEGTDEAKDRLQNLEELLNKAAAYEASFRETQPSPSGAEGATLQGFLEEVSLVADIDSFEGQDDRVVLMTLHSAKGLEFPNVYITGMDEGLFPAFQAVMSFDPADMEEERRLCYVGITRAMDHLTLTGACMRMLRGQMQWYGESRFLEELPYSPDDTEPDQRTTGPYDAAALRQRSGPYDAAALRQRSGPYAAAADRQRSGPYDASADRRTTGPYTAAPKPWEKPAKNYAKQKPFMLSEKTGSTSGQALDYDVGDMVSHVKFGQGVVKEIRDGGRDKEVTVEFERYGVKKMFAGFAKLKRVE